MHAIIMGAGEGTRMWPISTMLNKHLLKLGGKPVIRIIVEKLLQSGHFNLDDITILCLEKDEKDYRWEFRDLVVNDEGSVNFHVITHNTGTAHEFYNAVLDRPAKENDYFLHYGDTITDLDYGHFIKFYREHKIDAMIAVTENIRHDYSKVDCGTNVDGAVSIVQNIEEKPMLSFPSWTGIGIFNVSYFMDVYMKVGVPPEGVYLDFGYHILPAMTRDGRLNAYQYDGRWFDVGNLRSYQKLYAEYQNKDLNL